MRKYDIEHYAKFFILYAPHDLTRLEWILARELFDSYFDPPLKYPSIVPAKMWGHGYMRMKVMNDLKSLTFSPYPKNRCYQWKLASKNLYIYTKFQSDMKSSNTKEVGAARNCKIYKILQF